MKYKVKDSKGNIFDTEETPQKFEIGQKAFIDSKQNIYSSHLGGIKFGNPSKILPATIHKVDSGSVDIASDTNNFVSLVFHGKKLKDYWTIQRESLNSNLWRFSKSLKIETQAKHR